MAGTLLCWEYEQEQRSQNHPGPAINFQDSSHRVENGDESVIGGQLNLKGGPSQHRWVVCISSISGSSSIFSITLNYSYLFSTGNVWCLGIVYTGYPYRWPWGHRHSWASLIFPSLQSHLDPSTGSHICIVSKHKSWDPLRFGSTVRRSSQTGAA